MTLEGVVSILEGMNPHMLETKLLSFLVDAEEGKTAKQWPQTYSDESIGKRPRTHVDHERGLVSYADSSVTVCILCRLTASARSSAEGLCCSR